MRGRARWGRGEGGKKNSQRKRRRRRNPVYPEAAVRKPVWGGEIPARRAWWLLLFTGRSLDCRGREGGLVDAAPRVEMEQRKREMAFSRGDQPPHSKLQPRTIKQTLSWPAQ